MEKHTSADEHRKPKKRQNCNHTRAQQDRIGPSSGGHARGATEGHLRPHNYHPGITSQEGIEETQYTTSYFPNATETQQTNEGICGEDRQRGQPTPYLGIRAKLPPGN
jgi:hypothetical protein